MPQLTEKTATEKKPEKDVDPAEELAYAKRKLLSTAAEVDPLAPLRSHPYMLVGISAMIGGILGASGGAVTGLARIATGVLGGIKPLAVIGTKAALLKSAAQHSAQAMAASPSAGEHAAVAAAYTAAAGTSAPKS